MLGVHPALSAFTSLQEVSTHGKHKSVLAKSKGGSLVTIEILVEKAIPEDVGRALSREASMTARLDHEAVVRPKALLLESDFAGIVTEFLSGVSLQRLLRFATGRGVRLPDEVAWYVVSRVVGALAHAHGLADGAVVHGGVAPESVVVGWDGVTKVADFGGARMRALVAPLLGTADPDELPRLVSPEEARGEKATAKSDVFCAALLAWRLATGRTPYARFRKSAAERMIAMSEGDVAKLGKTRPDLPAAVRDVIDRALDPDPAKRTVTAQEILDAVKGAFDLAKGQAALAKVLERWRDGLEEGVSPWEKRGSLSDAAPPPDDTGVAPGTLALASPDDRPSGDQLLVGAADSQPIPGSVPAQESALAATGVDRSLSRVGAAVPEALTMPPLPPMRITMPSLPVYGGPAVNIAPPPPPTTTVSGRGWALAMAAVGVLLIIAAVMLLKWLSGPPVPH